MVLDGMHTTSGSDALHVHIDNAATAGGRLYAYAAGGQAIFKNAPTHIYGRMKMYIDTNATPILSVDDHGAACVAPTPVDDPWYGPAIDDLFVGAWSFHAMNAPLDVWIDDLVIDTSPVTRL
jgi:hypothetical protein